MKEDGRGSKFGWLSAVSKTRLEPVDAEGVVERMREGWVIIRDGSLHHSPGQDFCDVGRQRQHTHG